MSTETTLRNVETKFSFEPGELPRQATELLKRLQSRTARVCVIGLGYVGLPLVLRFCEAGFRVTGFDVDAQKVEMLNQGRSYIYRIAGEEIDCARNKGFEATSAPSALTAQDVILLCVPTPLNDHHEPDLSYIEATAQSIAPFLRAGQLIILESTTYPGTTDEILIPLLEAGNTAGLKVEDGSQRAKEGSFYVAFSPEREDPGNTTVSRYDVPKVVGGREPVATKLASALYESIVCRTVPATSTRVAEMVKLLENIYRCVNIALVNELKILAMQMDIDIWEVIDAAATKPFGFQPFYPGPGLGGHCIPIDPFYLSWKAREYGFHTRFIELAGEINEAMPQFVVHQVASALNTRSIAVRGARVLVLGMSYKRDIDDLRESPSLKLIELLRKEGAQVAYSDPYHPVVGRGRHYDLQMTSTSLDELETFDCVLIATNHSVFDYSEIVRRSRIVVDTRNATKGLQGDHIFRC